MTHKFYTVNNKLVVQELTNQQTLANGIKVQEARGKKDIIKAKIIIPQSNKIVWYPIYAALPLSLDGETYQVIDKSDIILFTEEE
jgi:Na+-transporting NADH:ubiquinone oxidoreductase subunit NqrC